MVVMLHMGLLVMPHCAAEMIRLVRTHGKGYHWTRHLNVPQTFLSVEQTQARGLVLP